MNSRILQAPTPTFSWPMGAGDFLSKITDEKVGVGASPDLIPKKVKNIMYGKSFRAII